jgi:hypothetical protein
MTLKKSDVELIQYEIVNIFGSIYYITLNATHIKKYFRILLKFFN